MRVKVRRVGNSLTVTIPKEIAVEIGIAPNMELEVSVDKGSVILRPPHARLLELMDEMQRLAAERGLTEDDIEAAILEIRGQQS
jgi:AbrB family looped-hinge helix DNA binding protein